MSFYSDIKQNEARIIGLRRYFHSHPELPRQEFGTAAKIESELDSYGITEHSRVDETGVYAVIRGNGTGKAVILRADIDALPIQDEKDAHYKSLNNGVLHACGHDFHTAALLGAAEILNSNRDRFSGEIRLFFQQAEEIGYGAKQFISRELNSGADRVFGLHTSSAVPSGKIVIKPGANNASVDHFTIKISGKSAHVSTPQKGVDALYIASQTVVLVQSIVSRQTPPAEPLLIGIGKLSSGSAYNIIADSAVIDGTVRAASANGREFAKRRIDEISRSTAALFGGTAEIIWEDYASVLVNDAAVCGEVASVADEIFGSQNIIRDNPFSLGGDDFAEYLLTTPGAYAYIGTADESKPYTCSAAHSETFDVDENVLCHAAALYADYAVAALI